MRQVESDRGVLCELQGIGRQCDIVEVHTIPGLPGQTAHSRCGGEAWYSASYTRDNGNHVEQCLCERHAQQDWSEELALFTTGPGGHCIRCGAEISMGEASSGGLCDSCD